jgi:hypothetical protein
MDAPESVYPVPVNDTALTVTGKAPVEVKVTLSATGKFSVTLPNARLVVLTLSVGTAGFNCKEKVCETPEALAVSVTSCAVVTEDALAVNPALPVPAGTVTAAGIVTAVLLLERLRFIPPVGAAAVRFTVQASVPDPVREPLSQESALNAADAGGRASATVPVPLRLMVGALLDEIGRAHV